MRNPFLALAFLVVSLTICALIGYAIHEKDLRVDAEALAVKRQVELDGAKQALLAKPTEVVKFVTVPASVKEAVRRGQIAPVAAGKLSATSGVVIVPCPLATWPTAPQETASEAVTSGPVPSPSVNLTFGLTGEFFIGKIVHGDVEYTSTIKGTIWDDSGWHTDVPFSPKDIRFDIVVSKDIAKAMEAYNQPWFRRHTALACPGVSILYNPLDPMRPVTAGITCGYSFVWF